MATRQSKRRAEMTNWRWTCPHSLLSVCRSWAEVTGKCRSGASFHCTVDTIWTHAPRQSDTWDTDADIRRRTNARTSQADTCSWDIWPAHLLASSVCHSTGTSCSKVDIRLAHLYLRLRLHRRLLCLGLFCRTLDYFISQIFSIIIFTSRIIMRK